MSYVLIHRILGDERPEKYETRRAAEEASWGIPGCWDVEFEFTDQDEATNAYIERIGDRRKKRKRVHHERREGPRRSDLDDFT